MSASKPYSPNKNRRNESESVIYGKLPPQAIHMEEAVLGACMLEKETFSQVLEIIQSEECFYIDAHQKIYGAMRRLFDKGSPVDLLTVSSELTKSKELELIGGNHFLSRLNMAVMSTAHVDAHARIVMEKFIGREQIRIGMEMVRDAYDDSIDVFEALDASEAKLYEVTDKHLRKNFKSLQDVLVTTVNQIDEARNSHEEFTGVPSGFGGIDNLTAGWQKTDLIILAARPSVGKTAFCINLILNAAMNPGKPYPVAFFSLEMSAGQIIKRMLSAVCDIRLEALTRGKLEEHEFIQMSQRMVKLAQAPIFIDDQGGLNMFELRAKARRLKQKHDIKMIVIDYLQLMTGLDKNRSREQEVSKISSDLKSLAKELDIPVIALSQLSRKVEDRKESKIPQLSDLRESGAIEQDADMVMFMYRPEYHGINNDEMGESIEGETHIYIAKHRNGALGREKLQFIKEIQRFIDFPEPVFGGTSTGNGNFGGNKTFVPGGWQKAPRDFSQSNSAQNANWDDDDDFGFNDNKSKRSDEDAPF